MQREGEATDAKRAGDERVRGRRRAERDLLLVDDNTSIRESLSLLFRMSGFRVAEAHDAEEALEMLATSDPDLIVTDLQMPGLHGSEFIRRARAIPARRARIIAISVHGAHELATARDAGADAWVDKLADFSELLAAARRVLGDE
jgi:CheY-like chemotaxis protein